MSTTKRIAFIALVSGVVLLWRALVDDARRDARSDLSDDSRPRAASSVMAAVAPAATGQTVAAPSTPSVIEAPPPGTRPPLLLEIRAPADVRVGDVFQARVDIEANAAIRDLTLSIAYEKSRLGLVGRSDGEFVQRPGIPADFGVDEPSDGNVQVMLRARDGYSVSGAGTIVVLDFEAIKAGTSSVTMAKASVVDTTGGTKAIDGTGDASGVSDTQAGVLRSASVVVH